MKIVAVIPARYESTRLPGKPLKDILGRPMIWWVYTRAKSAKKIDEVIVATDDNRIKEACEQFCIPVVMTKNTHPTAAHRLQEVSDTVDADFYIQINGDEPMIDASVIDAAIPDEVPQDREFGTNIITEMHDPAQVLDASNIKMVFDNDMNALYMSRTPIPYPFKAIDFCYYKHVGILGYNKKMLDFHRDTERGRFEKIEGIDSLRFIDYGKQLKLILVSNCETLSVDTEKDLKMVTQMMKERGFEKHVKDEKLAPKQDNHYRETLC